LVALWTSDGDATGQELFFFQSGSPAYLALHSGSPQCSAASTIWVSPLAILWCFKRPANAQKQHTPSGSRHASHMMNTGEMRPVKRRIGYKPHLFILMS